MDEDAAETEGSQPCGAVCAPCFAAFRGANAAGVHGLNSSFRMRSVTPQPQHPGGAPRFAGPPVSIPNNDEYKPLDGMEEKL